MDSITAVFSASPARESPNVGAMSDDDALGAYFRALVVAFASAVKMSGPDGPALQLVTDSAVPAPYDDQLERLGVTVRPVPFAHRPPPDFARSFGASLYFLDALAHQDSGDTVLYVDPDVVFVRDPSLLFAAVAAGRVGALALFDSRETDHNGLTHAEAAELFARWDEADGPDVPGRPPAEDFTYYGGECYLIGPKELPQVQHQLALAWDRALALFHSGAAARPRTEEHLMNHVLRVVPVTELGRLAARVWTTGRVRVVPDQVDARALWHVPAEKGSGLDRLHSAAIDPSSWFWSSGPAVFQQLCARALGVHHRRLPRLARDTAGRVVSLSDRLRAAAAR